MRDKLKQRIIDDIRKLPTLLAVDSVIEPAGCVQISLSYGLTGEVTEELSPREPRRVPAEQVQFEDDSTESWSETFRRAADWIEREEQQTSRSLDVVMITGELYFDSKGEGTHGLTIFHETKNSDGRLMLDTDKMLAVPSTDELAERLAQVVIDVEPSRTFEQVKHQMREELLSAGYPLPACQIAPEDKCPTCKGEGRVSIGFERMPTSIRCHACAGTGKRTPPNPDASIEFTAEEASRGPCGPAPLEPAK